MLYSSPPRISLARRPHEFDPSTIDFVRSFLRVLVSLETIQSPPETGTPDIDPVSGIAVKMDAVVSTTAVQVKTASNIELDLTYLYSIIGGVLRVGVLIAMEFRFLKLSRFIS